MGIFSFIKSAGEAYLKKSTLTARKKQRSKEMQNQRQEGILEGMLYSAGLKINQLEVELEGQTVKVYGETKSAADREKAILILGNVDGIENVEDRISLLGEEAHTEFYKVQKGDSLSKIAKKFYGDPLKYNILFEANKEVIKDPNLIYPGQVIRLPALVNPV